MKHIDNKLHDLRAEVLSLAKHCNKLGDEKTRQLLLEVDELLEVTHSTFLGQTLRKIASMTPSKYSSH
jgi:archaellum component FlaC